MSQREIVMFKQSLRTATGFSLIELMVAMLIGLILLGGVYVVQGAGHKGYLQSESQAEMLDSARFVFNTLGRDIRMAGSLAGADVQLTTGIATDDAPLPPMTGDCQERWYIDFINLFYGGDNAPPPAPFTTACFSKGAHLAGTDVLSVRYALPQRVADNQLAAFNLYLQVGRTTNITDGLDNNSADGGTKSTLFIHNPGTTEVPTNGPDNNYLVQTYTYYVSEYTDEDDDKKPSLHRVRLGTGNATWGTPLNNDELIATGVVSFQLQYGIDWSDPTTDDDGYGSVDQYVDASDIDWTDAAVVNQIITVRAWLLLRSEEPDSALDTKTYQMGSTTYTPNNNYRHNLVSNVFQLRNRM